jgi:hypothetical protein
VARSRSASASPSAPSRLTVASREIRKRRDRHFEGDLACMPYETAADCAFDSDRRVDLAPGADQLKEDLEFNRDLWDGE